MRDITHVITWFFINMMLFGVGKPAVDVWEQKVKNEAVYLDWQYKLAANEAQYQRDLMLKQCLKDHGKKKTKRDCYEWFKD